MYEFNLSAPVHAAVTIAGVNDQYEYELSDQDPLAVSILDVLQEGDNQDELDISLTYDAYNEDERIFFRLREPITTSDFLIVRYTLHHTISGLDSAVESTLPAHHDQILVDGACWQAIMSRAASLVESINLSKDQSDNYREVASRFRTAFQLGLREVQRKQPPVSEPDPRRWEV